MKQPCIVCGQPASGTRCRRHERQRQAAYGRAYRRARATLIGFPCGLRLPGCTGIATTADHVIPVSRGGKDGPLRPACAHCKYARGDRTIGPEGGGRVARGFAASGPSTLPASTRSVRIPPSEVD